MNSKPKLILGSGSPRRKEILSAMGLNFQIITPSIDESSQKENPVEICEDICVQKFLGVSSLVGNEESIIITGDTIVCYETEVFGKPVDRADAFRTIKLLSGKEHEVISSLCVGFSNKSYFSVDSESTRVKFLDLDDSMINYYLDKNTYNDKAGSYAIQDPSCFFVSEIIGSLTNVIGMPVELLSLQLSKLTKEKYESTDWKNFI